MKRIAISEFHKHLHRHLYGEEPLVIVDEDDRPVGQYLPDSMERRRERREAVERLGATVERVLAETGMTEDELARFFDLSQPLPGEEALPAAPASTERHGSDH